MAGSRAWRRDAVRAFSFAFPVGAIVPSLYWLATGRGGLFDDLTLEENLVVIGVILGLWLVAWLYLTMDRRRFEREEATDPGPIELPPRDIKDMTGLELAEWARDDPKKLDRQVMPSCRSSVVDSGTGQGYEDTEERQMRRAMIGLVVAASVVLGTSATAFAGEVNGKGEPIPGAHNASSECAFSGRDLPDEIENNPPGFDDDAIAIHGAQSYGQFVAAGLKDFVPSPGVACRGN